MIQIRERTTELGLCYATTHPRLEDDPTMMIQLGQSFADIPIYVNNAIPKNEIWMVSFQGEVTRFTITLGCELCGAEPCEARNEDDITDIWCDACYAEQRPEEVYQ